MKISLVTILAIGLMGNAYAYGYGLLGANFAAPTIDGKDSVYAPDTGDIVYDASDATFYGRTHSSAWVAFGGAAAVVPVGSVITFAGSVCPTGYILADGSAISRTTYGDLFTVIGKSHGVGNGSTTFNLPDYRGRFLRGVDGTAGNDPDKTSRVAMNAGGTTGNNVGSVQGDQFKSHSHSTWAKNIMIGGAGAHGFRKVDNSTDTGTNYQADVGATGGNETRPKNAYVNFCIKH